MCSLIIINATIFLFVCNPFYLFKYFNIFCWLFAILSFISLNSSIWVGNNFPLQLSSEKKYFYSSNDLPNMGNYILVYTTLSWSVRSVNVTLYHRDRERPLNTYVYKDLLPLKALSYPRWWNFHSGKMLEGLLYWRKIQLGVCSPNSEKNTKWGWNYLGCPVERLFFCKSMYSIS